MMFFLVLFLVFFSLAENMNPTSVLSLVLLEHLQQSFKLQMFSVR